MWQIFYNYIFVELCCLVVYYLKTSTEIFCLHSGRLGRDCRLLPLDLNLIKAVGAGTGWRDGWLFAHGKTAFLT
jgi:hypothetical protein